MNSQTMLPPPFYERYLEIQCQIFDNKIQALKSRVKSIKSEMRRDYRLKSLLLERKKNRIVREYRVAKQGKIKSYDALVYRLNSELQDLCNNYNSLFKQLESFQ